MIDDDKPFEAVIHWGTESTRKENPEACHYKFDTEAEMDAFLLGADESSGWSDYETVKTGEVDATDSHPTGDKDGSSKEG